MKLVQRQSREEMRKTCRSFRKAPFLTFSGQIQSDVIEAGSHEAAPITEMETTWIYSLHQVVLSSFHTGRELALHHLITSIHPVHLILCGSLVVCSLKKLICDCCYFLISFLIIAHLSDQNWVVTSHIYSSSFSFFLSNALLGIFFLLLLLYFLLA